MGLMQRQLMKMRGGTLTGNAGWMFINLWDTVVMPTFLKTYLSLSITV